MINKPQRLKRNYSPDKYALMIMMIVWSYTHSHVTTIEISDSQLTVYTETIYYDVRNTNTSSDIGNSQLYLGKICLGNDNHTVDQCIIDYEFYSHSWILLVSDQFYFNDLKYFINTKKYKPIQAVIANNSTITSESLKELNYPLFWCNQPIFDIIKQYNVIEEKDNYHAVLVYQSIYSALINQIALIAIILLAIINSFLLCWWMLWVHHYRNFFPHNISTIQLLVKYFLGLKMILSIVYVYYFENKKKQQIKRPRSLISIYINVILMGINSVDISLFWLFLILISNGWFIYKSSFTNAQARKIAVLYIVFFGFVIFDQVINILIKMNIVGCLKISDLKNVIMYTVLIEMCRRFSMKTLHKLKRKYTYAYLYSNEFLQPLRQKITLIKWHLGTCVTYYVMHLIQIGILKTMIRDDKIVELLWGYLCMGVMILLAIVNRPRRFSYFYFVYNEGNRDEMIEHRQQFIYLFKYKVRKGKANCGNYSRVISDDLFKKEELEAIQNDENYPIIILSPYEENYNYYGIGYCNYIHHYNHRNNNEDDDLFNADNNMYYNDYEEGNHGDNVD